MKNILVLLPVNEKQKEYLEKQYPEGKFTYNSIPKVEESQVTGADIILGNAPAEMVAKCQHLELLQLNSAGADPYMKEGIMKEETILANSSGAYGLAIAEHALGQTLMLMKNLNHYYESQQKHQWTDAGLAKTFYKSRTLIVGLGDLGCEYAKRVKALGSYVVGIRRRASEKPKFVDELYTMDALKTELPKADIVAFFLPGTKTTYHIVNKENLSLMKDSAILINCGRGNALDQEALAEALNQGVIFGAATDVTEPEPLPEDHPLWVAKNMLITPHASGKYHLVETLERVVRIAGENLNAIWEVQEVKNEVDFQTGYRKKVTIQS